jgi:ADP-heptose:LPS heptosyltransferase
MTDAAAVRRVVVLRALGLGDLLTVVPALRAVRRAHPSGHVTLLAPAALCALLPARLVDEVRDTSFVHGLAADARLDDDLAGADLAVNLHGRGPQSTTLLERLEPHRLVAFGVTSAWRDDEHEVHRWCRLLDEAGMPADPRELDVPRPTQPPAVADAVVVHPGAALPSRRWPVDRWAEVARAVASAGEQVVVTGAGDERELADDVARLAGLPPNAVLAGTTSVTELAGVIGAARLLLSSDTGVAHLATALGTPSVVLFGPTPPALWGPPADRPQHRALWAGRRGANDAPRPDPGLLELSPGDVLAAAAAVAGRRRPGAASRTVVG